MQGVKTIEERKELLETHRQAVLEKQALLLENLKEIDYKLEIYNAKNAAEIVQLEIDYVKDEKNEIFS